MTVTLLKDRYLIPVYMQCVALGVDVLFLTVYLHRTMLLFLVSRFYLLFLNHHVGGLRQKSKLKSPQFSPGYKTEPGHHSCDTVPLDKNET
jgi:hypothetical protein